MENLENSNKYGDDFDKNDDKEEIDFEHIEVNTVINLDELHGKKETSKSHQKKKAHINYNLKNAFCVSDAKYLTGHCCETSELVEVTFDDHSKAIYKNPENYELRLFEYVIVELENGLECATVIACGREAKENLEHCYEGKEPEQKIVRIASSEDLEAVEKNRNDEERVTEKSKQLIEKHKLEMKITGAAWQFDRNRLTIFFTAPQRIDFRELVKDLAHYFRTRIELRQISSREEARRIGGMGPCGLTICCASFGSNRCHITLEHARHQQLANNVSKLSGYCGRLKCCLLYEHDVYVHILKDYPPLFSQIDTKEGVAILKKIDIFKENVRLYYPDLGVYKTQSGEFVKKLFAEGKVKVPTNYNKKDEEIIDDEELSQLEAN